MIDLEAPCSDGIWVEWHEECRKQAATIAGAGVYADSVCLHNDHRSSREEFSLQCCEKDDNTGIVCLRDDGMAEYRASLEQKSSALRETDGLPFVGVQDVDPPETDNFT